MVVFWYGNGNIKMFYVVQLVFEKFFNFDKKTA